MTETQRLAEYKGKTRKTKLPRFFNHTIEKLSFQALFLNEIDILTFLFNNKYYVFVIVTLLKLPAIY